MLPPDHPPGSRPLGHPLPSSTKDERVPQAAPTLGNHLLILLFPQSSGDAAVVISRHFCCPGRCSLVHESNRERKLLQDGKRNRGWQGLQQAAGEGRARPAQAPRAQQPTSARGLAKHWEPRAGGQRGRELLGRGRVGAGGRKGLPPSVGLDGFFPQAGSAHERRFSSVKNKAASLQKKRARSMGYRHRAGRAG